MEKVSHVDLEGMKEDESSSDDSSTSSDSEDPEGSVKGGEGDDNNEDEMGEDDEELLAQLSETNYKLSADPFSYDLYVEKIQMLKRLGDAEALRDTREKLSQLYPLNEKLWLDWIRDEITQITGENRSKLYDLLDRAVKDYLSIEIWLEYAQFQLGELSKENGIARCRTLFERALSAGGLHVPMGTVLWDMYRQLEGDVLGMTELSKLEEQEDRYISLCKRQLAVPLLGLQNTYKYLKNKITIDDATEASYKASLKKLESIQKWEDKLAVEENVESKSEIYKSYIEVEKTAKSNPARRICLYERAVADCPLDSSLWLDFYEFTLGINLHDLSLDVIARSSRNCPWVISIWTHYLCHLEQHGGTQDQVKEIFEKALLYCPTGEQAGTLWLKYLEILRRRIDISNPNEADVQLFNKTVDATDQHLRQLLEEPSDFICQVLLLQVRTRALITKSIDSTKELWSEIYKRGYGSRFNVWLQGLQLEKECGAGPKELRRKYEKGLGSVQDYPQLVMDLWLNFERDYGDGKSLHMCESKIERWMVKAQETQNKKSQTAKGESQSFNSNRRREGLGFKRQRAEQTNQVPGKKGKYDMKSKKMPQEYQKSDEVDFKAPFPPKQSAKLQNNSASSSANPTSNREYQAEEWKLDPKNNDMTIFVSNLAITSTEEILREFFSSSGNIGQIRLAKNYKGVSKRYAYITFCSMEEAQKALKRDRESLNGRPVFVSRCEPDKSTRSNPVNFKTGLERDKLFVKGIPVTTTKEELTQLFETHAKVKECRLVTYKSGESKGLAYVDFFDEQSARLVLSKLDGSEFQGSTLFAAFSNPPKKSSQTDDFVGASVRKAPTMFVPRSLQVGKPKPENNNSSSGSSGQQGPLSNNDFRNFFRK